MKINIILSALQAISAWLHGEGGKHFRTYTYPRIKQRTRQILNLGIYEYIEKFYKVVDDTYYKGDIAVEPQDPLNVVAYESLVQEIQDTDEATTSQPVVPKLSDIKDDLIIWKGPEQGNTYRCATFAMNNMLRSLMLELGLQPPMEVTAIDPLYIETKYGTGQTGTVVDSAFAYLASNGHPMVSWTPMMTDHNTELVALEASKAVKNAIKFPGIKTTGNVKKANTYEEALELDRSLPVNWRMQVSINFSASLKYFGQLVPSVQKVNGKYSLVRTGGHSVHGVRGSFSTWEDGEAGFVIVESAYRSSEDGWRFLNKNLFLFGVLLVRFVEYDISGFTVVNPTPIPAPTPTDVLATNNVKFGQRNNTVVALQEYLLAYGISIPAGATGYFGVQTRTALKQWQDEQFGAKYDGSYWGEISRSRYLQLG